MFRIIEIPDEGTPRERSWGEISDAQDRQYWIDVSAATDAELELLRVRFNFHPLAIDDCKTFDQRPKLEEFGDHLFIVIHLLRCNTQCEDMVSTYELHCFLGERYLVSVHADQFPELDQIRERVLSDLEVARRGVAFLYYLLADRVADSNFVSLDTLSESLEDIEEALLERSHASKLPMLFRGKRALSTMRRILSPQRDLFGVLSARVTPWIPERANVYFRDVHDKLIRTSEALEWCRDLLSNLIEAHFTSLSNRTNEIMKHLTLLSAIFLPLTFVTGFFGQNFTHLPFHSTALMWGSIGGCLLLPIGMMLWFRYRRWM